MDSPNRKNLSSARSNLKSPLQKTSSRPQSSQKSIPRPKSQLISKSKSKQESLDKDESEKIEDTISIDSKKAENEFKDDDHNDLDRKDPNTGIDFAFNFNAISLEEDVAFIENLKRLQEEDRKSFRHSIKLTMNVDYLLDSSNLYTYYFKN